MNRFITVPLLFCVLAFITSPVLAITIDTVFVGDAGNAGEFQPGIFPATLGGVPYNYRIATTEVTVGQYAAFLNAVAATDTYGLYDAAMATDLNTAGIARANGSGNYTYSVIGSPNKPVTHVTWGDAAQFTNWLHNGQPNGPQNVNTTETGAYALNGNQSNGAMDSVTRSAGAKWFIPSENEWYKAAYFQPANQGGDSDNYWAYPNKSNAAPYSDQPPGIDAPVQSRTANIYLDDAIANGFNDGWAISGTPIYSTTRNYLTDVGAYTQSIDYYGTFDMAGNVAEWTEGVIPNSGLGRNVRGGDWLDNAITVISSYRNFNHPSSGEYLGFRVATVPEPGTLALAALGRSWLADCRTTPALNAPSQARPQQPGRLGLPTPARYNGRMQFTLKELLGCVTLLSIAIGTAVAGYNALADGIPDAGIWGIEFFALSAAALRCCCWAAI